MNELENFYLKHKKIIELALYKVRHEKYTTRNISKKNGGIRVLSIPPLFTRIVQRKFNDILQKQYLPLKPVHGFVKIENDNSKSIISNASQHIKKRYVINVDIENFFDTINFGRVRGLFLSKPFNTAESIATKLAQLVIYDDKLPQGSPASPIISNLICKKLDHELIKVAKEHSLTYTRYADDITFSTYKKKINFTRITRVIDKVIKNNGFTINKNKTRIQKANQTQVVTGLKVNQKLNLRRKYIKQIRSMLFSWFQDGLKKASDLHFNKFNKQESKYTKDRKESFKNILIGKINFLGQVKGKEDRLFIKFSHTYYLLRDDYSLSMKAKGTGKLFDFEYYNINNISNVETIKVFTQIYDTRLILTEGVSDVTYIKSALKYFQKKEKFKELKLRYCHVGGIATLSLFYRIFYEKKVDMKKLENHTLIEKRKCLFSDLDKNLKLCFVMDADDDNINKFKRNKDGFTNFYLLDEINRGYIEKLFDKDIIIQIIEEHGYEIDVTRPQLKKESKEGLESYLKSPNINDKDIHSVRKTSYIAYEKKIIEKTLLSNYITKLENINYDEFEELFINIEKMSYFDMVDNKSCSSSLY